MTPPLLQLEAITRDFDAVRAVDSVSLEFAAGEVHGVIGENGAGKSTLMKVVAGIHAPTAGRVRIAGRDVALASAREALAAGIVMIHQEFNLVDELSIAENIFLGREPSRRGLLTRGSMREEARAALARLGVALDPDAKVGRLSTAQCQLVEIAKALTQQARILIMDEPTAVLTPRESEALHGIIRQLRGAGVLVILISHRLEEVLRICDRITVLRDGRFVRTLRPGETSEKELAEAMVGRALEAQFPQVAEVEGGAGAALEVAGLSIPGLLHDVSLAVRRGEIVGLAGLIGAGRTELGEAIVGLRGRHSGTIWVDGREVRIRSVKDATAAGIAYLSEDRKGRALNLGMDVAANVTMVSLHRYCRAGLIDRGREAAAAEMHGRSLGIRMSSARQRVETLSGGNQQKVAVAKWLEVAPRVLILDEPTRGVDVGAKREIYGLIGRLAGEGRGCLVISSEMPELLGLCHRILVMRAGRIAGILERSAASQERVMYLAAGVRDGQAEAGAAERMTA
jgi:ribose transport system ATP-binding protein